MKHEEALHIINLEILEPRQIMFHRWHINQAGSVHNEQTVKSLFIANWCQIIAGCEVTKLPFGIHEAQS